MRFTLRQIELFVAACNLGSISAAAEQEHIAQSAVSTAIQNLEEALGVSLLIRNHAVGVQPTAEGRDVLARARLLLDEAHAIETTAATMTEMVVGPVHVGFLVTVAPLIMPRAIRSFRERFPQATLIGHEGDQAELLAWLRSGVISVAVSYDLGEAPGIGFHPLRATPPHILLAADHPLAAQTMLGLDDLRQEPLILLDLPWSVDYFLGLFRAAGMAPAIGMRTRSMDVVRSAVGQGLGYALVNLLPVHLTAVDGQPLVSVPLTTGVGELHLGLLTPKRQRASALVRAVLADAPDWIAS